MQTQTRQIADRVDPATVPAGDYLVVGRDEPDAPGIGARIAHGFMILMVLVLALVSFAIFWVVGLLLNIF
jgi:hypothetical protein